MRRTGKILPDALRSLLRKPATVSYPQRRDDVFTNVRGKLLFDEEKCIGCKLCMRDCPAKAIEIEKVAEKKFKAVLHADRCIYCGQCVDSCHKDALRCTTDFELAQLDRKNLKVDI
ncbi:MAG: 4Fe-4S binding protein [Treponema sp.]|nr:4Fe-4S binding protein [Treponema sp.]